MSVSDLSGRFELPSTGRLQRLLSNSASTDCCSMRFSLRMMTSGALRSTSFLRRLLRLMMRRERGVKNLGGEVAPWGRTSGPEGGGGARGGPPGHPFGVVFGAPPPPFAPGFPDL